MFYLQVSNQTTIHIDSADLNWINELKKELEKCQKCADSHRVWLVAQDACNGIIGLINCLRQEPGGDKLRSV